MVWHTSTEKCDGCHYQYHFVDFIRYLMLEVEFHKKILIHD